jgi:hypothetical protein
MYRILAPLVAACLILAPGSSGAQGARLTYEQQQQASDQAQRDYKEAVARYEAARADYDRKYGTGAYDQTHRPPFPPAPARSPPPSPPPAEPIYSPTDGPPYLGSTCLRRSETDRAGLAAAIAGALGSGPAAASSKAEGAVLGALIDGTLGSNLATSETSGRRYAPECDAEGFFFSFDQTFPYRESSVRRLRNGEHDQQYYFEEGCRLAVAPIITATGAVEYHYARVCPDRRGRYRFTG